jgi:dTDP-glucose 4,6-dehydratase
MRGKSGETYNIGGKNEKTNLEVVKTICEIMDKILFSSLTKSKSLDGYISGFVKNKDISSHKDLIIFVDDRPGHDIRYAIDNSKIEKEFNFTPKESFETGIQKTIKWYLKNLDWCKNILNKNYTRKRLGIIKTKN